jgi:hypothetical protein
MPDLQTALLDLLYELQDSDVKLIIGGGFGIYLKVEHVRQLGVRTLLNEWPEPRSTNDLDLFLRPELLIQPVKLKPLRDAFARLGYVPVVPNYQFVKPGREGSQAGSSKIDLLTGPEDRFDGTKVRTDDYRAKPTPSVGIHAHPVNEALTLEEGLLSKPLEGRMSTGIQWQGEIFLPHSFTFLMMKLFAFRDQHDKADKGSGRHHALDLYTILATTTEIEWNQCTALSRKFSDEKYFKDAGDLVSNYFSDLNGWGMIRLRESPYFRKELQLDIFMSSLKELFPLT